MGIGSLPTEVSGLPRLLGDSPKAGQSFAPWQLAPCEASPLRARVPRALSSRSLGARPHADVGELCEAPIDACGFFRT